MDALALSLCYPAFLITADVPEIYIQQFWFTISKIKDSSSYQFKLDKKKCRIDVEVFRDILQICPRLPNQEFDEPPSDEEIVSFVKELGYKGDFGSVTVVYTDHMHQPWRTLLPSLTNTFRGKSLIDNRDSSAKRKENMPYPRFTKAIIQHFISKDKSISMRNRTFIHIVRDDSVLGTMKFVAKSEDNQVYGALILALMLNQKIQNSNSYKTYLDFETGAATPKKARKWKKPASFSKKQTLLITKEPAKKPAARKQPTDVQIRDTPGVSVSKKKAPAKAKRNKGIDLLFKAALLEETQMKKAIKRIKRETHMHQAGGSDNEASFQPEVPDKQKGKSIDTHKGTGLKPGVFVMSEADSFVSSDS
ncbi:hypothetical protein Tco_0132081 [Tanacetum coccineum]